MTFDKVQYKSFGPFVDLRFLKNGEVVSELRALGPIPGRPSVIDWTYSTFEDPCMEICASDQKHWQRYGDDEEPVPFAPVEPVALAAADVIEEAPPPVPVPFELGDDEPF